MSIIAEAEGYLDLELFEDAWVAVDGLPDDACSSAPAIRIRMRAAAGLERWDMVEILAKTLQYGEARHREEAANAFHALAREQLGPRRQGEGEGDGNGRGEDLAGPASGDPRRSAP